MEEFHDKYIHVESSHENMEKVKEGYYGVVNSHNEKLIYNTTEAYNDYLTTKYNITKKIKSKDLIKIIKNSCRQASEWTYPRIFMYNPDDESQFNSGYYLFSCNYFESDEYKINQK